MAGIAFDVIFDVELIAKAQARLIKALIRRSNECNGNIYCILCIALFALVYARVRAHLSRTNVHKISTKTTRNIYAQCHYSAHEISVSPLSLFLVTLAPFCTLL